MKEIIISSYVPGAIGRISELHAEYYSRNWGFGALFEAGIAGGISDLMRRYDEKRDRLWTVTADGRVEGSIAIDGARAEEGEAFLRWFLISSELRGRGLGNTLLGQAIDFCRKRDYSLIYLWTFEGLEHSRHLYDKFGFRLGEERKGTQWGKPMIEQKLILEL